ncbi:MAG: hypothetical protein JSR17_05055 [Proteobacteria bacterium]|nr:hypothetical protein [Pseudomonadota bacterium]
MLTNLIKLFVLTSLLFILPTKTAFSKAIENNYSLLDEILGDFYQFYCTKQFAKRTVGYGLGGYLANSSVDPHFRNYWQDHLRNDFTNKLSTAINDYSKLTSYPIAAPIYLATLWLSTRTFTTSPDTAIGIFANHALRTLVVGAPEQFALTHFFGSGRPQTEAHRWEVFKYHRAVSGHAFYGAIPLLNLAKQQENPWLKTSFYVLSALPGLARVNCDKHYLSQVWLGWWLANSATQSVWESDIVSNKSNKISLEMVPLNSGIYLGLARKF